MPVFQTSDKQQIDYLDEGEGETIILIHSSVSGNRQWIPFITSLKHRYRVIAPNLFGYGETSVWVKDELQTLGAQSELIIALCAEIKDPLHLVGHSFGGAVALKTASLLSSRVDKLVLYEPMTPCLLQQNGRHDAYSESKAVVDHVKHYGALGDWSTAAGRFADYWLGNGSWDAMPEKRQAAFAMSIQPCIHEFEAMLGESLTIDLCRSIPAKTMVMHDNATRRPILEIVTILQEACPHWTFKQLSGVGHMAPITHPELINLLIEEFLNLSC